MRLQDFSAQSDLVGRRVRVGWEVVLEGDETLAHVPPVRVRRKQRDFEFPPLGGSDPTLLYDSSAFPPPGTIGSELPSWESREGVLRHVTSVESAAVMVQGQPQEVVRRTRTLTFDETGRVLRQRVEVLDTGFALGGLVPGHAYYYQLFSPALPLGSDPAPYRAIATATDSFGLSRTLYEMLPAIYRRHDVRVRAATPGAEAVPEATPRSGQLRRMMDLFGVASDSLRSSAESLRGLHDIAHVDYRFLPLLARWIGWELSHDAIVPVQRNEIASAPALYAGTGTPPNLRALVNYYTGWYTQIAEFVQHITRATVAPQLNVFALHETPTGWRSTDDAADALGFVLNEVAEGNGNQPAHLTSALAEPFALAPGMKLVVVVNDALPVTVQFWPGDFVDMGHATAAEVARVLDRAFYDVRAYSDEGHVRLESQAIGEMATLQLRPCPVHTVTLEGAAQGRLAPLTDPQGRVRLFYAISEPATEGEPYARERICYKSYHGGRWHSAHPCNGLPGSAQGSPAALLRPDQRVQLFWIEEPHTAKATLRTMVGQSRLPIPARLVGQRRGPFAIAPGSTLTFRRNHAFVQPFTFQASDFANAQYATVTEVAAALNARVPQISASPQVDGTLLIETVGAVAERLEIDLALSTAARQIGFSGRNHAGQGAWDDEIAWDRASLATVPVAAGYHADLSALRDASGGFWLFWARHAGGSWQIATIHFDGVNWSSVMLLSDGSGGHREPHAVTDQAGNIWLFWAAAEEVNDPLHRWTLRCKVYWRAHEDWGAEFPVTTPLAEGRAADRQPSALLEADGTLRVFFQSDREVGGPNLWSLRFDPTTQAATEPEMLTLTAAADHAPAPVRLGERLLLLYRSERSVALAQSATPPPRPTAGGPALHSQRIADTGTLRRFAGTTSARLYDMQRNGQMKHWDDLLAYTPERVPLLNPGGALVDSALYTPNTVGIYVSPGRGEMLLASQTVERLRQVLERSLPVNLRAVIILAPRPTLEMVYEAGSPTDIAESYWDDYPFVEYLGSITDGGSAAMPDWLLLLANDRNHLSGDTANLRTLRSRTHRPPVE